MALTPYRERRLADVLKLLEKYGYDCSDEAISEQLVPYDEGYFDEIVLLPKNDPTNYNHRVIMAIELEYNYALKFMAAVEKNNGEIPDEFKYKNLDLNRCVLTEICVEGPVSTTFNDLTNADNGGICLTVHWRNVQDYCRARNLNLYNIEQALWIQNNQVEYSICLLKNHLRNLKLIYDVCLPVLKKYDFHEYSNSLFHKDDEDDVGMYVTFSHVNTDNIIYIETDIFDGSIRITGFGEDEIKIEPNSITIEKFDKIFYNKVIGHYQSGEFDYINSKDPNENINSYYEILNVYNILNHKGFYEEKKPNMDNIPLKYFAEGSKAEYKYMLIKSRLNAPQPQHKEEMENPF